MEIFYLLFISLYALLLWSMKRHWQKKKDERFRGKFRGKTAILLPFRNEAKHLPGLLVNLANIVGSSQEVLFIDDGSTDGSAGLISSFIQEGKHEHWVLLENAGVGKKAALTTGVHFTRADIILTTDADCILPEQWVDHMTRVFYNQKTQLVAGPVITVTRTGFFARFQQIEWASLLLMTQYFFSKGFPMMCSGANLAYRRSAFLAVEGYLGNDRYPSGDDEFLLKKVVRKYGPDSVIYLQDHELLVKTLPMPSWAAFVQQRIRWAGKWRLHGSVGPALAATLAFVVAVVEISTVLLLFGSKASWLPFLIFWAVKIGVEKKALGNVLRDYRLGHRWSGFIGTSILHPVYVVVVGLRSINGRYIWKGRNHNFKY